MTSLNTSLMASNCPISGIYREEFLSILDAFLTKMCCEVAFGICSCIYSKWLRFSSKSDLMTKSAKLSQALCFNLRTTSQCHLFNSWNTGMIFCRDVIHIEKSMFFIWNSFLPSAMFTWPRVLQRPDYSVCLSVCPTSLLAG